MSDFHRNPTSPVARKQHKCIACFALIPRGEKYTAQSGFYDGLAYNHHFHNECFATLLEQGEDFGEFEFTPGECEPPQRLTATLTRSDT